jgi:hypothetical protein
MATVRKQLLIIEKDADSCESVELSFWVDFTQREVEENISFGMYMALLERDEEFEKYHTSPNGVFNFPCSWFNPFKPSSVAHWMEVMTIHPNGSTSLYFNFRKTLDQIEKLQSNQEYRAFIFVVPEITCGKAWTNDVCINYR